MHSDVFNNNRKAGKAKGKQGRVAKENDAYTQASTLLAAEYLEQFATALLQLTGRGVANLSAAGEVVPGPVIALAFLPRLQDQPVNLPAEQKHSVSKNVADKGEETFLLCPLRHGARLRLGLLRRPWLFRLSSLPLLLLLLFLRRATRCVGCAG
jgi:hypothetical protein